MTAKRLAVLADIHANLPALEAALSEIEALGVDEIIVAGDMLTGPNPLEVLQLLRSLGCRMIRGNHENYLLRYYHGDAPDWWYTSRQWAFIYWNYQKLLPEWLDFLAALPEQLSLDYTGMHAIRVVHGSPRNVSELVNPQQNPALLDLALSLVPEPVVVFGHTHNSWQVCRDGRLALNPGALSGNFTGKPCGGYALLDWADDHWRAGLYEVHYNIQQVQAAFRESGLLEAGGPVAQFWLQSLETGVNVLPGFVEYAIDQARKAGFYDLPFVPDHIWEQAAVSYAARFADSLTPPSPGTTGI
ncbi:MAG TPA: metallophosphoesterase family protein [Anaerolineales bacterium]|jgi:putative phosphoesterase